MCGRESPPRSERGCVSTALTLSPDTTLSDLCSISPFLFANCDQTKDKEKTHTQREKEREREGAMSFSFVFVILSLGSLFSFLKRKSVAGWLRCY